MAKLRGRVQRQKRKMMQDNQLDKSLAGVGKAHAQLLSAVQVLVEEARVKKSEREGEKQKDREKREKVRRELEFKMRQRLQRQQVGMQVDKSVGLSDEGAAFNIAREVVEAWDALVKMGEAGAGRGGGRVQGRMCRTVGGGVAKLVPVRNRVPL